MLPKLVAFVGPIGCGKTTAANVLENSMGYKRIAFADPLKQMLMAFGLTAEQVYGKDKETPAHILGGRTPRYAMQTLGTEWGRDLVHKDLWVRAWQFRVQQHQFVVVDDARFPNEFALIKALNGIILGIIRPGIYESKGHESEQHLPPITEAILNASTEHNFRLAVVRTVKSYATD